MRHKIQKRVCCSFLENIWCFLFHHFTKNDFWSAKIIKLSTMWLLVKLQKNVQQIQRFESFLLKVRVSNIVPICFTLRFFLVIMHLSNKVSIKIEICCVLWGSQFSFTNSMILNESVSERRNKAYKNLAEASKHLHHLQWLSTTFEIERKVPHKPQFYKPQRG